MTKDYSGIVDIEISGVDPKDYPDFADSFVINASWPNGIDLTDSELDTLNDQHPEIAQEKALEHLN